MPSIAWKLVYAGDVGLWDSQEHCAGGKHFLCNQLTSACRCHLYYLWRCKSYQSHCIRLCIFLLWHGGYHSLVCCDFRLFIQLMAQDFSLINLNGCWCAKHCILWFIEVTSNAYSSKAFQNPICLSLSALFLFLGISFWWTMKTDAWLSLQFLVRFTLNFMH